MLRPAQSVMTIVGPFGSARTASVRTKFDGGELSPRRSFGERGPLEDPCVVRPLGADKPI